MNCNIFNRLGRALLRPLIWRQMQKGGSFKLTERLRCAISWYVAVLQRASQRVNPFVQEIKDKRVVLYSDADGNGQVAAVAIKGSTGIFMKGRVPSKVRRMLKGRKTNIVAYELLIAVASLVSFNIMDADISFPMPPSPFVAKRSTASNSQPLNFVRIREIHVRGIQLSFTVTKLVLARDNFRLEFHSKP